MGNDSKNIEGKNVQHFCHFLKYVEFSTVRLSSNKMHFLSSKSLTPFFANFLSEVAEQFSDIFDSECDLANTETHALLLQALAQVEDFRNNFGESVLIPLKYLKSMEDEKNAGDQEDIEFKKDF